MIDGLIDMIDSSSIVVPRYSGELLHYIAMPIIFQKLLAAMRDQVTLITKWIIIPATCVRVAATHVSQHIRAAF